MNTNATPLAIAMLCALAVGAAAPGAAQEWSHYGGDEGGRRFVDAGEITPANVSRLTRAWVYRTGHANAPREAFENSKFQVTPILAEGRLALCTPFNVMIALDPGAGRELWRHDPAIDMAQDPGNDFNCRGVTYWRDPAAETGDACAARLFMGTNDHRLVAVDLANGRPCEDFGAAGVVAVDPEMDLLWPGEFHISSAPVVAGEVVIVGSAISDNARLAAPRGAVRAYDVRTGRLRWSWDPIPRTRTSAEVQGWPGAPTPQEGHANAWAPMAVDSERGLVFIPTSSPSPDFFGGLRPGDNRNADSVVALDAASGHVRWSFQTVHHDVWDYDLPAQPLLATIQREGRAVDVVIQVTKTGLVFTLDRDTGQPVIPVEERAVPQGGVDGEALSSTQPFPVAPEPLAPSRITPDDAWGLTPFDRGACARRLGEARAEGLYTPPSTQGTILYPFTGGGANWGGAAFDPVRNRLYINTSSVAHVVTLIPRERAPANEDEHGEDVEYAPMQGTPYGMTREVLRSPVGLPCNPPPWGTLHAIDMNEGNIAWRSTIGTTEDLAPLGLALRLGTPNFGGPLVTSGGLVFIGAAMDRYLRAFDAENGREIWQGRLPAGGQATPMSYVWEGRQYVVIAAGGHSMADTVQGDYVVAFALPRPGEPGPSFASRTFDRPGGRFAAALTLILVIIVGSVVAYVALRRRSCPVPKRR